MSWSLTIPPTDLKDFTREADAARLAAYITGADAAAQCDLAVDFAKKIAASSAVGGLGFRVGAVLSGHANPDHHPQFGWSDDTVTITVYQSSDNLGRRYSDGRESLEAQASANEVRAIQAQEEAPVRVFGPGILLPNRLE